MMVLRRLETEDMLVVKGWLEKEHVKKWFGDASEWMYEIEHRKDEFNFIKHFIVEEDGVSVGFCQYYDWKKAFEEEAEDEPEGSYGIDYMIGDELYLGKGLGIELVRLICDKVIEDQVDAVQLIADPTIEEERVNRTSIKVLEKNGFKYDEATSLYRKRIEG